jgi:hypothetical protein
MKKISTAYKVFISCAHQDRDLAKNLANSLTEAGASVQQEPRFGEKFSEAIQKKIRSADEVIVLLTVNSIQDNWVMYELGIAFSLRKRVTPILVGVEPPMLPPFLQKLEYVSFADPRVYLTELKERAESWPEAAVAAAR